MGCCCDKEQAGNYLSLNDDNLENLNKTMSELGGGLNELKAKLISLQNENINLKKENNLLKTQLYQSDIINDNIVAPPCIASI